jgi:hypothetical protein
VKGRRSFDEHVQLFAAYGAHIAQLRPASWDRLRLRCVDLGGPGFRSLLRRARLASKPNDLYLSKSAQRITSLRVIGRRISRGSAHATGRVKFCAHSI